MCIEFWIKSSKEEYADNYKYVVFRCLLAGTPGEVSMMVTGEVSMMVTGEVSMMAVEDALASLMNLTECRCPEAYTARNRHAPECVAEYREEVETLRTVISMKLEGNHDHTSCRQ